ncbi:lipid-A-disaccharide synthase [Pleomorphovibrio marinus]|uniref:lipid-A-disaccharide synthase n=1 Tax=Pleomorphovibrio marinus TaxID=2164132 RepID=UPI000E0BC95D|nr:lipid-A-disaccharide synthase [Pleomorphovibrio marinus]
MKYYLIAGERSGDLHASNLIYEIKYLDSNPIFRGMGGDYMAEAGCYLNVHFKEMSMMGFLEVVLGARKVLTNLQKIKRDILEFNPDAIILVDFGGFNMKMAAFAKQHLIPVHYYIPPKVWAWNRDRAIKLKKMVDGLYTILPFEPEFFSRYNWEVPYVGNPVRDEIAKFKPSPQFLERYVLGKKPIIALLPGSRKQEVRIMLGLMVKMVKQFVGFDFVVAAVDNLAPEEYEEANSHGIKVVTGGTYDLLTHAHAAVVTSGTATLETALFHVPQVVVYKTSMLTYAIGKNLVKVPYISLVNLVAGKKVVEELIQGEYTADIVAQHLKAIAEDGQARDKILDGYKEVGQKIGTKKASQETARLIVNSLKV